MLCKVTNFQAESSVPEAGGRAGGLRTNTGCAKSAAVCQAGGLCFKETGDAVLGAVSRAGGLHDGQLADGNRVALPHGYPSGNGRDVRVEGEAAHKAARHLHRRQFLQAAADGPLSANLGNCLSEPDLHQQCSAVSVPCTIQNCDALYKGSNGGTPHCNLMVRTRLATAMQCHIRNFHNPEL